LYFVHATINMQGLLDHTTAPARSPEACSQAVLRVPHDLPKNRYQPQSLDEWCHYWHHFLVATVAKILDQMRREPANIRFVDLAKVAHRSSANHATAAAAT
jgi:hypothetical protein